MRNWIAACTSDALRAFSAVRAVVGNIDLQRLQQWAVDARYPADLPDITVGEAAAVVAIADQIVAAVAAALRENGPA